MNFKNSSGKSIDEAFRDFHKANPQIYSWFKKYFFHLERKGKKKISGKLIIERVRWEAFVKTTGEDFRINNNFTSRYVRLFIREFPQYSNYFELRTIHADPVQQNLFQ